MANLRTNLARGALVGATGVVLWATTRRRATGQHTLLDWRWATSVAERVSGPDGRLSHSERAHLLADYRALVQKVEQPLQRYTGTTLPLGETTVEVMDRADWIRANVVNFSQLFEPLDEAYARGIREGKPGAAIPPLAQLALSSQFGLLIGYLARRVLGQYDVSLLGKEPVTAGKLYFVEPNIRALERKLAAPPDELREWIVLHEATHAHEFEVHPWVRVYLNTTLRSYLSSVVEDMLGAGSASLVGTLAQRLTNNLRRGQSLLNALMTPQQRELVSRLQALMSLAEGYSNHVMNAVGRQTLPHFDEISRALERRQRQRSAVEELFLRITGLKLKLEQYKLGERFVDRVVAARGMAFLNRSWDSPAHLPSEAEIREPERWIARMEVAPAPGAHHSPE